jgi:chromosome segregation ATPase
MEVRRSRTYLAGMDTETRAAFDRIDHWFELIQAHHVETKRDMDELRTGQDALRVDLNGMRAGQGELRSDVNGLRTDVNGLRTDVNGLQTGQDSLRTDLNGLRTDVNGLQTGQDNLRTDLNGLRTEMRDGFRSVGERLTSIERDVGALWGETRANGSAISGLSERVTALTERMGGLEKRVDTMSDDMRQRFRIVIERLTALEHATS